MSGIELIAAERERQIAVEGWTAEHDDDHDKSELALAAICYASPNYVYVPEEMACGYSFVDPWPWDTTYDKRPFDGNTVNNPKDWPHNVRLDLLIKAGALIAAEIDRLQRAASEAK